MPIRNPRRVVVCTLLAALPVGVELPAAERTGELEVSLHGGGGQAVTVIRDCSGNALRSDDRPFAEVSAGIQYRDPVGDASDFVFGVRGGWITVEGADLREEPYAPSDDRPATSFHFVNPYLAFEAPGAGIGAGWFGGDVPARLDVADRVSFSAHLRFGPLEGSYFRAAINESAPLITGGGPFELGVGYAPGDRLRAFTGLSMGFYDRAGVAQRFGIELSDRFVLDLGLRVGRADDRFEGGGSVGLRFRMPGALHSARP